MTKKEIQEQYKDLFSDKFYDFSISDGWLAIITSLLKSIKNDIMYNDMPEVKIIQIKQKFGGLRVYYDGGDDATRGMVTMAMAIAEETCEDCGSTEDISQTSGYIRTLCTKCKNNHEVERKLFR